MASSKHNQQSKSHFPAVFFFSLSTSFLVYPFLRHFVDGDVPLLESNGKVLLELRLLEGVRRALQVADIDVLDAIALDDLLSGLPVGRAVQRGEIGLARALRSPRAAPLVFVPHPAEHRGQARIFRDAREVGIATARLGNGL